MGEGVHTSGRGESGRHALHQLRIIDGDLGGNPPVYNGHLHLPSGVGNDTETGDFRSCSRGGVDCHQRHQWTVGLIYPFVVMDGAAVGSHHADAFGTVVGRTAAQREDRVTPVVPVDSHTGLYILIGRIGFCSGKDNGLHTGLSQNFLDLSGHAALMEKSICDNHGLMAAQALHQITGFLGRSHSKHISSRQIVIR